MKKWSVYMLRCGDGSLYTGIAIDVEKRLNAHRSGKGAKYTRGRLPLEVVWRENDLYEGEAKRREIEVKKMSRRDKELLIKNALLG